VRALGAEQQFADERVDAVGAHYHLGLDAGAVSEGCLDVVAVVDQVGELVTEMDPVAGQRPGQGGEQVGPVDLVLGEPEGGLQRSGQRGAQQGAAVVPAPLMPGRRLHASPGQLLGQPEPMQHPGGVGAEVDAGTDLAQHRRLLVHLDVNARLQQRQGGAEAADAAADDGHRDPVRGCPRRRRRVCPVRAHRLFPVQ
jgi:hypothetical protein